MEAFGDDWIALPTWRITDKQWLDHAMEANGHTKVGTCTYYIQVRGLSLSTWKQADPCPRTGVARAPRLTAGSHPFSAVVSPRSKLCIGDSMEPDAAKWRRYGLSVPVLVPVPVPVPVPAPALVLAAPLELPVVCDRRPAAAERGICQLLNGPLALSGHESSQGGPIQPRNLGEILVFLRELNTCGLETSWPPSQHLTGQRTALCPVYL
jgi:hypothetical protein